MSATTVGIVELPESDHCHRCQHVTKTVFLPLSSGHIGNCCAVCRTTRKGKPYVSRRAFQHTNAVLDGQRSNHGLPIRNG